MDTRRLITTMLFVGVVMLAFMYGRDWFFGKEKKVATTQVAHPRYVSVAADAYSERGAVEAPFRLGDPTSGSSDKLAITINNKTAGIDLVELNEKDYSEYPPTRKNPARPLILMKAVDGSPKPYATIGLHITPAGETQEITLGKELLAPDATVKSNSEFLFKHQFVWHIDAVNKYDATLSATIAQGDVKLLIKKTFKIDPSTYDISISHEVLNMGGRPCKVAIDQLAAIDLPVDPHQSDYRFYHAAGLDTAKAVITKDRFNLTHAEFSKFDGTESREIGKFQGNDPVEWVASSGQFFVAITRPTQLNTKVVKLAAERGNVPTVEHVEAAYVDILHPDAADASKIVGGLRLTGAPVDVEPNATVSMPLAVYFGPKDSGWLSGDIHAAAGSDKWAHAAFEYITIIQFNANMCFCYKWMPLDELGNLLVWLLHFFRNHLTFGNYGVAIILLTIVIRALLHPLTRASQVNMATMGKKMKDVQPIVEAMKKKYAKDKQKQNEEMMRIYREHNVNPAGGVMGCLPMLLQMPIWIAMWSALRTDISLRNAVFIPGWINDLSAPDMTMTFAPFHIPLVGWEVSALNVLPLLLGIVFFLQMKVTTASQPKPADEQQAAMQKMSQYMILMFPIFLYNLPSGLNLYYFASTLGGLVDTYFVRKTLKKKGILPASAQVLPTHQEKLNEKSE